MKKKLTYEISYYQGHTLENWGGIDGLKKNFNNSTHKIRVDELEDDWANVLHTEKFKARNIEEAKKMALEFDIPDGVFVVNHRGKKMFTEEDLE